MRISKALVYCNVMALLVNVLIVWLTMVRVFAPMLGLTIVVGFLLGAVWFSAKANGKSLRWRPKRTFYSASTEKGERI